MRRTILFVLVALFAVVVTGAAARGYTGTVGGLVLEGNGRPAAGAEVIIERSDGSAPRAARTNTNGQFLFKFVLAGFYDIRASRGGTTTVWKHNIMVHAGKETAIDLRLEPIHPNSDK
ncbi:MAG: carboxypeptidase-like regulatory domain-containing protein [Candidatus Acidiferrales bacterium]